MSQGHNTCKRQKRRSGKVFVRMTCVNGLVSANDIWRISSQRRFLVFPRMSYARSSSQERLMRFMTTVSRCIQTQYKEYFFSFNLRVQRITLILKIISVSLESLYSFPDSFTVVDLNHSLNSISSKIV